MTYRLSKLNSIQSKQRIINLRMWQFICQNVFNQFTRTFKKKNKDETLSTFLVKKALKMTYYQINQ